MVSHESIDAQIMRRTIYERAALKFFNNSKYIQV